MIGCVQMWTAHVILINDQRTSRTPRVHQMILRLSHMLGYVFMLISPMMNECARNVLIYAMNDLWRVESIETNLAGKKC